MSKTKNSNKRSTTKGVQQQQKKKRKGTPNASGKLGGSSLLPGRSQGVAAAYAKGVSTNKPVINYRNNGNECNVRHKEFISNVVGTVAFTTPISVQLNPGLGSSFPWLANIANNFEQYRVNRMVFKYLTRTGSNTPGSVLIYPDYDAADAAPLTEQIASNYQEIAEDAPWKDISCVLKQNGMHSMGPKKFVRATALAANLDIKTYDVGTLFLSTVDGTVTPWGKLWVEYDITFFEPQLNPSGPPVPLGGLVTGGGVMTGAAPLGSIPAIDAQSLGFSVSATSVITFTSANTVLVSFSTTGTVLSAPSIIAGGGSAAVNIASSATNTAGTNSVSFQAFTVLPGSTLTLGITATTVTGCICNIAIAPTGSLV